MPKKEKKSVAEALTPSHLIPENMEEAVEKVEEETKTDDPEEEEKVNPAMLEREYTFKFEAKSLNGTKYEGTFTSVIPSIKTRQKIGVLRAQMSAGLPPEALDGFTSRINEVVSHLEFALLRFDSKDKPARPEWAMNFQDDDFMDNTILEKLYEEVMAHEATFFQPRQSS